jgi:hypothetical protein
MKRLILTYGMIAGTIELALLALSMGLVSDHGGLGMALGYLSMLIAMSLVFVGVKRFRDEHQGGVIRFGKAFLVGLGIQRGSSLTPISASSTARAPGGLRGSPRRPGSARGACRRRRRSPGVAGG